MAKPKRTNTKSITLRPRRIVAGLAFHILDSGLARKVDDKSKRETVKRLSASKVRIRIDRQVWEGLSNEDRLIFLAFHSSTGYADQEDGVAVLAEFDYWQLERHERIERNERNAGDK